MREPRGIRYAFGREFKFFSPEISYGIILDNQISTVKLWLILNLVNVACSVATKLWKSLKLWRFLSEYPSLSSSLVHFQKPKNLRSFEDFMGKLNNILDKIVQKSSEICTFLKTLNFNFPHMMLSSTAGKICLSCCLKENF